MATHRQCARRQLNGAGLVFFQRAPSRRARQTNAHLDRAVDRKRKKKAQRKASKKEKKGTTCGNVPLFFVRLKRARTKEALPKPQWSSTRARATKRLVLLFDSLAAPRSGAVVFLLFFLKDDQKDGRIGRRTYDDVIDQTARAAGLVQCRVNDHRVRGVHEIRSCVAAHLDQLNPRGRQRCGI